MIQKTTGAPASDPVVKIGGKEYTLRYSFRSQYIADRLGVSIPEFVTGLKKSNAGTLSNFVALLAAMIAHNFPSGTTAPTPDQWAEVLDAENKTNRQAIFSTVAEVLVAWINEQAPAVRLSESVQAEAAGPKLN